MFKNIVQKVWQCRVCDRVYKLKSHMEDHVESAHVNLNFNCPYNTCEKSIGVAYKTRKSLQQHTRNRHKYDNQHY